MTTNTEALRAQFERRMNLRGWSEANIRRDGLDYSSTQITEAWHAFQAGHAAAKAEAVDVGEPVAFAHFAENGNIRLWAPERPRDLDGNAAQPLYTADQLAAAVAAERERAAQVCDRIADDYNRSDCLTYPELMTDAGTGANDCAAAIRARTDKENNDV